MERKDLMVKKQKLIFLKNMIKSMKSIELIEIYEETCSEVSYYKQKMDMFLELWRNYKLDVLKAPTKIHNLDYYTNWILDSIKEINSNDEWLLFKDEWWAKVKTSDKEMAVKELWDHDKYGVEHRNIGYIKGFLAIDLSINMIIYVGLYSDDEYNYQLCYMKI